MEEVRERERPTQNDEGDQRGRQDMLRSRWDRIELVWWDRGCLEELCA